LPSPPFMMVAYTARATHPTLPLSFPLPRYHFHDERFRQCLSVRVVASVMRAAHRESASALCARVPRAPGSRRPRLGGTPASRCRYKYNQSYRRRCETNAKLDAPRCSSTLPSTHNSAPSSAPRPQIHRRHIDNNAVRAPAPAKIHQLSDDSLIRRKPHVYECYQALR
jgi:hypothetical protein